MFELHTGGALCDTGLWLQSPTSDDLKGRVVHLPHCIVQEEPLLLKYHLSVSSQHEK